MDLYSSVSYKSSRLLTRAYSTSFSLSSLLFPKGMRQHIYAIYGLVRIADEIVDTYAGTDSKELLEKLEGDTYAAINRGYDTNPIIHAFAETASYYSIGQDLIAPFFNSMRIDLNPPAYNESLYREYIHGSAEVVGLMCLRVFCKGDDKEYARLQKGAEALGSAYQKVNFLRDIADDYQRLDRVYFPNVQFETFDETSKHEIIKDIEKDFALARVALDQLPKSSRLATMASYAYYQALLNKLKDLPASQLRLERVRISNFYKILLLVQVVISEGWKK